MDMRREQAAAALVTEEINKTVTGKEDCIRKVFAAILAGGHVLMEDVPGVGKTTLAVAFSKAMNLVNARVQFTPDVTPADILGFSMYRKDLGCFEYQQGPVMCNLFLADEINRTSPRTQSALLEVMEEGQVSADGTTMPVPEPFIVIATQNPKGSAGTQLLPESQLDRFMICISMGYPDMESEIAIAKGKTGGRRLEDTETVLDVGGLLQLKECVEEVYVHNNIYLYIVKLMAATRVHPGIELGVSPRGTIACTRMAKAWAFLKGRDYVIPQDVQDIFQDVAKHRIVLNAKARVSHTKEEDVLREILEEVKQPASYMRRAEYHG